MTVLKIIFLLIGTGLWVWYFIAMILADTNPDEYTDTPNPLKK